MCSMNQAINLGSFKPRVQAEIVLKYHNCDQCGTVHALCQPGGIDDATLLHQLKTIAWQGIDFPTVLLHTVNWPHTVLHWSGYWEVLVFSC